MLRQLASVALVAALVLGLAGTAGAGLTGYWPVDGNIDESLSGKAGGVGGSDPTPTYVAGLFGQAFDFGTGGVRYISTHADLTTAALGVDGNKPSTVSLWIWQRANTHVGKGPYVFSTSPHGDGYKTRWLWRYGSTDADWLQGTNGPSSADLKFSMNPRNGWHHVVLRYLVEQPDPIKRRFRAYFDGVQVGYYLLGQDLITDPNARFLFGTSSDRSFPGWIDDIGVYNEGLDTASIVSIYNFGKPTSLLPYDLGKVDQLFEEYKNPTGGVVIDGRLWTVDMSLPAATGGDLVPDGDQFILYRTNTTGLRSSDASGAIPEPASLGLFTLALIGLRRRRS
jgi:hypothetical protein